MKPPRLLRKRRGFLRRRARVEFVLVIRPRLSLDHFRALVFDVLLDLFESHAADGA